MPQVLNIQETVARSKAEGLPVSEYTLRRLIRSKAIPFRQVGRTYLIYWPNLVTYLTGEDAPQEDAPAGGSGRIRRLEVKPMEDKRETTRRTIQEVKERSGGAENVALFYGLSINPRTHRAVCPFHAHKNGTPDENLSFFGGGFVCFQCGAKGSALDYVQLLFGCSTATEAARRLNDDMHMGLFRRAPQILKSMAQRSREAYSLESEQAEDQLALARFIYGIQYHALVKALWQHHDSLFLKRSLSPEE